MGVRWIEPQESCPIIGDELEDAFERWVDWLDDEGLAKSPIAQFEEWLTTTADGALALRRLVEFPRQRALEFPDEGRPWVRT